MLKLKLQYFGHLMWRANSLEKALMLGKIEGRRGRGQQRIKCLDNITNSMNMNLSKLWQLVKHREAWPTAVHGVTNSQTWLSNWTATTIKNKSGYYILKKIEFCSWRWKASKKPTKNNFKFSVLCRLEWGWNKFWVCQTRCSPHISLNYMQNSVYMSVYFSYRIYLYNLTHNLSGTMIQESFTDVYIR